VYAVPSSPAKSSDWFATTSGVQVPPERRYTRSSADFMEPVTTRRVKVAATTGSPPASIATLGSVENSSSGSPQVEGWMTSSVHAVSIERALRGVKAGRPPGMEAPDRVSIYNSAVLDRRSGS
jgi:hypothetical protein